ncbi:MAG: DUF4864 domain-containing protein [Halobacteriaceae archaeon]
MADGPPLSRRAFARRLRRLPRERLAAFVADLWALGGWETEVADGHVVARRGDEQRRLLVYRERRLRADEAPPPGPPVDVVVTTGGPDGAGAAVADDRDADLVTAGDLYDRLLYAVDRTAAKALLWDYFDAGAGVPVPSVAGSTASRVGALAVALAVVVAVAAGAAGVLSGVPATDTSQAAGPATTVQATTFEITFETETAGGTTPTATPTPTTTQPAPSRAEAALAAFPTCERSPGEVVGVVVDALAANDEVSDDPGILTAYRFLTPGTATAFGTPEDFEDTLRTPSFRPLLNATNASLSPTVRPDGTTAVQDVTVVGPDGNQSRYTFRLALQTEGENEGCWLVSGAKPAQEPDSGDPDGPARALPNCTRTPAEVVETQVGLFRANDPATNDSIENAYEFLTPGTATAFGSAENFASALYSGGFRPLLNATNVTYGPVNRTGDTAFQRLSVASPAGNATYSFTLARITSDQGRQCWRVESAGRVG